MTATIPAVETDQRARDRSSFHAYAVPSASGPHVTMQAGVEHAGRFWTTSSARSLKARSVAAHGIASAVLSDGDDHRVVAGQTTTFRPFRPWDALGDPLAPLRSASAVARLSCAHIGQLLGYLEAAGSIPSEWFPTRRVLLVTRIERSLRLEGHTLVDATGPWGVHRPTHALGTGVRTTSPGILPYGQLESPHRDVVRVGARAHVGVSTPTGPVSLPARWLGEDRFEISAPAAAAVTADLTGPASAVFDQSASRRPDEKLGVMFRGTATLDDVDGDRATVALHTERITTWDGFDAGTVSVRR